MARAGSQAEHYRAHREAFVLALELKCTPAEAARQLRKQRAAEANRQAEERLAAKMAAPITGPIGAPLAEPESAARRDEPWMMRD